MGGSSRAAGGFQIIHVDIDNILMLFPCADSSSVLRAALRMG
jgi:hypothetical protein